MFDALRQKNLRNTKSLKDAGPVLTKHSQGLAYNTFDVFILEAASDEAQPLTTA